jgi:large conductance mechanosensitive channel
MNMQEFKMDPRTYAKEFRDFLLKSNMFSMAMGVVIGAAVSKVVDGIVKDLVMPFIGILTPAADWEKLNLNFWRFHFTTGHLISVTIDFLIIATVVFLVTKMFFRTAPPPPTKPCMECLEPINPDARRCKWCCSEQKAVAAA